MTLYLMRHGQARSKEEDPGRGLTPQGAETVRSVAMDFSVMNPGVRRILHSGRLRARQTAEIVAELLPVAGGIEEFPGLAPDDEVSRILPALARMEGDTLVVGHLPHLSRLASALLLGDPDRELINLRPGGIVCLDRQENRWRIEWMIRPVVVESG